MRCILLKPVLKYTYHTIDHLNHFCQHTTQWHELAGSPASGTYCLMSWGGAAVRWTESKHHEECNQSAHLETISHPSPWKNYLPWENYLAWYWSLVPKRSGTTGTKDTYSVVPPPPSIPRKFSSSQIESLNLQNSDSAFSPSALYVMDLTFCDYFGLFHFTNAGQDSVATYVLKSCIPLFPAGETKAQRGETAHPNWAESQGHEGSKAIH